MVGKPYILKIWILGSALYLSPLGWTPPSHRASCKSVLKITNHYTKYIVRHVHCSFVHQRDM